MFIFILSLNLKEYFHKGIININENNNKSTKTQKLGILT